MLLTQSPEMNRKAACGVTMHAWIDGWILLKLRPVDRQVSNPHNRRVIYRSGAL